MVAAAAVICLGGRAAAAPSALTWNAARRGSTPPGAGMADDGRAAFAAARHRRQAAGLPDGCKSMRNYSPAETSAWLQSEVSAGSPLRRGSAEEQPCSAAGRSEGDRETLVWRARGATAQSDSGRTRRARARPSTSRRRTLELSTGSRCWPLQTAPTPSRRTPSCLRSSRSRSCPASCTRFR